MGDTPRMALSGDKFYRARITEREEISHDLWKIKLDPGGKFDFVAGQYATLGVPHGDRLIERAYSIVSSPYESQLEIFFELVHQGSFNAPTLSAACGR